MTHLLEAFGIHHSISFEKSGFCKIIEKDIGTADEKKEEGTPQKKIYFILIDLEPFAQHF